MKRTILLAFAVLFMIGCNENIDDKAAREAKEFTEKYCPGPIINQTRIDSTGYDRSTRTYTYYYTFTGVLDDKAYVAENRAELDNGLRSLIINEPSLQPFVKEGIVFQYVVHSFKNPEEVIYTTKITF